MNEDEDEGAKASDVAANSVTTATEEERNFMVIMRSNEGFRNGEEVKL